jgi:hypothetical protein
MVSVAFIKSTGTLRAPAEAQNNLVRLEKISGQPFADARNVFKSHYG